MGDDREMTPEQRASLAGQASARFSARLRTLDTSFQKRLGDEITETDQLTSMADLVTSLMNEVICLWAEIEALRRRLGDEGPFEVLSRGT